MKKPKINSELDRGCCFVCVFFCVNNKFQKFNMNSRKTAEKKFKC